MTTQFSTISNDHLFWLDGKLCEPATALVSMLDHGLLYGDGVFEGIRLYQQRPFMIHAHLRRLSQSATALRLELPYSLAQWTEQIEDLAQRWHKPSGYLRLIVTRGTGSLGIDPRRCQKPSTMLILGDLCLARGAQRERGIHAIISQTRRTDCSALDPRIKSLNYLNHIMAKSEANEAGADEAILLNQSGRVAEASSANLFIVKHKKLITPPWQEGALEGVTAKVVLDLAKQNGYSTEVAPIDLTMLYSADECFITGTGAELIPVASIHDCVFQASPGPIFQQLNSAFSALADAPDQWHQFDQ